MPRPRYPSAHRTRWRRLLERARSRQWAWQPEGFRRHRVRSNRVAQWEYQTRTIHDNSFRPPAGDLLSLDLAGWKRHAPLSLFKLGDGRVVYTDGRHVGRGRPTEAGGIDVQVSEFIAGDAVSILAETLLQPC
eukprot:6211491-Pleurochrysis_carterae.AAC.1